MKNKIIIIVSFLLSLLYLSSCMGTLDWSYALPNGYELTHVNSVTILVSHTEEDFQVDGIPSFIKEFAYDDRYVFTRNVVSIDDNNIFNELYYVLDTKERKTYGPFENLEILKTETENLKIEIPKRWYRTSPDPYVAFEKS